MGVLELERESSSSDGLSHSASNFIGRPHQNTISGRVSAPRWASPWWLLLLGLAVTEVVALGVREQRVPAEQDWARAAAHVRGALGPNDAITVAPAWADPLLRLYLGDRISLKLAGRSDLAAFERLWVLSIRGARAVDAPLRVSDFSESFGRVRVDRYDFGPSPVLFDFADALAGARVERRAPGEPQGADVVCPLRSFPPPAERGGLGGGIIAPRQRFQCDYERPWLWVGVTAIEALDLSPRRCIWTHPQGREPISVSYRDVPFGPRLVLYAGLDYHDERDRDKAPVDFRVLANGRQVAHFVHRDGDGMARYELNLRRALGAQAGGAEKLPARGELRFEVSTSEPFRRSFCWTGSVQSGRRREAP